MLCGAKEARFVKTVMLRLMAQILHCISCRFVLLEGPRRKAVDLFVIEIVCWPNLTEIFEVRLNI